MTASHRFLTLCVLLLAGFVEAGRPPACGAYDPRQSPEVAPLLQRARHSPDDRPLRLELCSALRRLGSIEGRHLAAREYAESLKRWPRDVDLLCAFGQLRVEQGFLSQGATLLRRALKHDPDRVDAEFGLARLALRDYLRFLEPKRLGESRRRLDRVLALEPGHRDALYFRVLALLESGQPDSAFDAARTLARTRPEDPWGELVLGALSVATGHPWEAAWSMEAGLTRLPEAERAPFQTLAFLDLVSEEQREELPADERPRFIDAFWKVHDPTPASPLNERLLEHRRRVVMAELLYGIREKRIRGWETAPGEAIIRFGMPESRSYTWGRRDGLAFAPPGLEQVHRIRGESVTLEFVDRNLSGRWVQPYNAGQPTLMERRTIALQNVGPELWPGPPLDCTAEVAQFRDPDGGTRLELALAARENDREAGEVRRDAAVYDTAWNYLARDTRDFGEAERVRNRADGRLDLVDVIPFAARGDSVWVGASVEVPAARSGDRWLRKIGVRRFPAGDLCLSDLLLLDRATFDPAAGAAAGRFARRDGEAVPNPRHVYRAGETVPVYFEAYNLAPGPDGAHAYSLILEVEDASPPNPRMRRPALVDLKPAARPIVTARFEEVAARSSVERLLDVSVGRLPEGPYRLKVTLEQDGGARRALATTRFRVIEKGASGGRQKSEALR